MKKLSIFLIFTLISYIFSTSANIDLKSGQVILSGSDIPFVIVLTPSASTTTSALSGSLVSTSDSTKTLAFTCTAPDGAKTEATDVNCKTTPTEAGTYKISSTGLTFTATDGTNPVTPELGTTTMDIFLASDNGVPSGITLDLKGSQTIKTGTNIELVLTVKPAGKPILVSAISGLELVLSTSDSTKTSLTCTISSATACAKDTDTEFKCTAASITAEGTYKLGGTLTLTSKQVDGTAITTVTPTIGTTTLTVSNSSGEDPKPNTSKYLNISFCLFLMLLFF